MNGLDMENLPDFVDISKEVVVALEQGRAVVALESTIITHGMPYPQNVDMAQSVEAIVRDHGAVPATIAVIEGRLKIGLSDDDLTTLAQTDGAMKISRADIGFAIAQGRTAGTTVAATMIVARMAGVRVFATGGIGGVHKGAEDSFDISADLTELGRTDVMVVAAGAKAILDVPKTLEVRGWVKHRSFARLLDSNIRFTGAIAFEQRGRHCAISTRARSIGSTRRHVDCQSHSTQCRNPRTRDRRIYNRCSIRNGDPGHCGQRGYAVFTKTHIRAVRRR